jgi:glycosyltransferase involved in cell wall biosynthesis
VLAEHLQADGVGVVTTSPVVGRFARAADVARTVRSWRGDVDVVVVLGYSGPAFAMTDLGCRCARRLDVPVVLWLHGGNLPRFAERHPRWARAVLAAADRLVAPSPYLARLSEVADRPVEVIPNSMPGAGAAAPDAGRARGPLRTDLLWMRTFHDLYRPELAVEVLDRLDPEASGIRLTMAGQDKGELAQTRQAVADRRLDPYVRFAGFLDPTAKAEAFAGHDLFLNTSRTDNAPVSLLEAAAAGLVVVSTPVGGIAELFTDGRDALLADDAAGLANAVRRVLGDAALARSVSVAGMALGQSASWHEVGPRWHRLLADVAGVDRRR